MPLALLKETVPGEVAPPSPQVITAVKSMEWLPGLASVKVAAETMLLLGTSTEPPARAAPSSPSVASSTLKLLVMTGVEAPPASKHLHAEWLVAQLFGVGVRKLDVETAVRVVHDLTTGARRGIERHFVAVAQGNDRLVLTDRAVGIGVEEVEDRLVGEMLALDERGRRERGDRAVAVVGDVEVARQIEGQTSVGAGGGAIELCEGGFDLRMRHLGNIVGAAAMRRRSCRRGRRPGKWGR